MTFYGIEYPLKHAFVRVDYNVVKVNRVDDFLLPWIVFDPTSVDFSPLLICVWFWRILREPFSQSLKYNEIKSIAQFIRLFFWWLWSCGQLLTNLSVNSFRRIFSAVFYSFWLPLRWNIWLIYVPIPSLFSAAWTISPEEIVCLTLKVIYCQLWLDFLLMHKIVCWLKSFN